MMVQMELFYSRKSENKIMRKQHNNVSPIEPTNVLQHNSPEYALWPLVTT
jgi:hypothetical protein